jgi:tRNA-dihydrouridine synthase
MMVEYKGERTALLEMRKHIAWYLHGLKDAHHIRTEVYKAENVDSVKQILGRLLVP